MGDSEQSTTGIPRFVAPKNADDVAIDSFGWLASAKLELQRAGATADLQFAWSQLEAVLDHILETAIPPSRALRIAYSGCLLALSRATDGHKHELALSSTLVDVIEARRRPLHARHFAAAVLGELVLVPKGGMRQVSRNAFLVFEAALKTSAGASGALTGYRRTLLSSLTAAVKTAEPEALDEHSLKSAWKLALANTGDPAVVVAVQAWKLLDIMFTPSLVRSSGSYDKISAAFAKSAHQPSVAEAAAQSYASLVHRLAQVCEHYHAVIAARSEGVIEDKQPVSRFNISVSSVLVHTAEQYANPATSPQLATLIAMFWGCLLRLQGANAISGDFQLYLTQITNLRGLKLDEYRVSLAHRHIRWLVVDVISRDLITSEKSRLLLARTIIQLLATTSQEDHSSGESLLPCLTGLIEIFGSSVSPLAESIQQTCLSLIDNSKEPGISSAAITCIKTLVNAAPNLLLDVMTYALRKITTHTSLEYASLVMHVSPLCNKYLTYVSLDLNSQVLSTATTFIKHARQSGRPDDLPRYQVGWLLLQGLLSAGPDLIKFYASQLLLLWQSCLDNADFDPKNVNKGKALYDVELRIAALTGLVVFMVHNATLVTPDVTRQLGLMLHQTWTFSEHVSSKPFSNFDLGRRVLKLRWRLLQCYNHLATHEQSDIYPASLLTSCADHIASPTAPLLSNGYGGAESGSSTDLNSLRASTKFYDLSGGIETWYSYPFSLDSVTTAEWSLFQELPVPMVTSVVDTSINVIAKVLPLQSVRVQESLLDKLRSYLAAQFASGTSKKKKNTCGFVVLNVAALTETLLAYASSSLPQPQRGYCDKRTSRILLDIIQTLFKSQDERVFSSASRSFGLLCSVIDEPAFVAESVEFLIDSIVSDLRPELRSGYTLALGMIVAHAKNKIHARHIGAILDVLFPLAFDPHPRVHASAIKAMDVTVANAGFAASKYFTTCLRILSKAFILDSHTEDTDLAVYSNLEIVGVCPRTSLAIAQGCVTLLTLMGPDIQTDTKALKSLIGLFDQMQSQSYYCDVRAESWRAYQQLFYFSRESVNWVTLIREWCSCIDDFDAPVAPVLKQVAIENISLLFKMTTSRVLEVSGPRFEKQLWLAYDRDPENETLKKLFTNWLEQTATSESDTWVRRLRLVIMQPRHVFESKPAGGKSVSQVSTGDNDDEAESLGPQEDQSGNEFLGWKTRQFAISLLLLLLKLQLHGKSLAVRERSDIARNVGDVIKIAFSAATSTVLTTQLGGLDLLNEIVTDLSDIVDPDFPEVSLLQQYQAQIGSALSPAFLADSSPELAMRALHVCGSFISSGVVKNPDKFGRLLKLLVNSVKSCNTELFALGDLKLSPNAQIVLKVGVLRVWASLEAASRSRPYLAHFVKPYEDLLVPLWVDTLRDYARFKFEPEQSSSSSFSVSLDLMKEDELRRLLAPTYRSSWLKFVSALATVIDRRGVSILGTEDKDYERFLFVLFGLCFEALLHPEMYPHSQADLVAALNHILIPQVCASVIYDEGVFSETLEMLGRLALTGTPEEQSKVATVMRNIAKAEAESDENVDHLFEIFRVCTLPLRACVPDKFAANSKHVDTDESLAIIKHTLDSLIDIVQIFREVIQNDLYLCLLQMFERIADVPEEHKRIAAHLFPSYKRLMELIAARYAASSSDGQLLVAQTVSNAFVAATDIYANATDEPTRAHRMLMSMAILCSNARLLADTLVNVTEFGANLSGALLDPSLRDIVVECGKAILSAIKSTDNVRDAFCQGFVPNLVEALAQSSRDAASQKAACYLLVKYALIQPAVMTAMDIVVPSLVFVLETNSHDEELREYVQALLVSLVQKHPNEFKKHVQVMADEERKFLQSILVQQARHSDLEDTDTSITLTSFG